MRPAARRDEAGWLAQPAHPHVTDGEPGLAGGFFLIRVMSGSGPTNRFYNKLSMRSEGEARGERDTDRQTDCVKLEQHSH